MRRAFDASIAWQVVAAIGLAVIVVPGLGKPELSSYDIFLSYFDSIRSLSFIIVTTFFQMMTSFSQIRFFGSAGRISMRGRFRRLLGSFLGGNVRLRACRSLLSAAQIAGQSIGSARFLSEFCGHSFAMTRCGICLSFPKY